MKKRLIRGKDRVFAGVCSGIANYFDVDPTLVRVIWAVLTVITLGIPGIIAYILAAFIIPDK